MLVLRVPRSRIINAPVMPNSGATRLATEISPFRFASASISFASSESLRSSFVSAFRENCLARSRIASSDALAFSSAVTSAEDSVWPWRALPS